MSFFVDMLWAFSWPLYKGVLGLFGYDTDWKPTRSGTRRRPPALSAVLCFAISALLAGGLIWLLWWTSE